MIRSLSLRRRCAAASKLASAASEAVRADRDRLVLVLPPAFDERARLLVLLERDRLLAPLDRGDSVDDDRARREPAPEPDLLEPPLLACGMVPPCDCYWAIALHPTSRRHPAEGRGRSSARSGS
jgi:hypothetical protein